MKIRRLINRVGIWGLLTGLLFFTGCDAPEVEVVVSPEYGGATIQVDFIKVPRSQLSLWMSKSVDSYFSPGDQLRKAVVARGEVHTVYYNVPGRYFQGRIDANDAVWQRFNFDKGSKEQDFDILILADVPGGGSAGGLFDLRRRVIPLHKKAWDISFFDGLLGRGLDKVTITLTEGGILLDPAPAAGY